jgi:hypothetical protein
LNRDALLTSKGSFNFIVVEPSLSNPHILSLHLIELILRHHLQFPPQLGDFIFKLVVFLLEDYFRRRSEPFGSPFDPNSLVPNYCAGELLLLMLTASIPGVQGC